MQSENYHTIDNVIYEQLYSGTWVNEMKHIILITIIFVIISSLFLGCVKAPIESTPTPTATATSSPSAIPTTPTPTQTPPPRIPSVYKVFVDQDYGFKRVVEVNYTPIVYENLTLNIRVGDTVIWINDATPDEQMTIVSEQDLWSNTSSRLRWNYQSFNYTFTQPGIYGVYVREERRVRPQKIVVNP